MWKRQEAIREYTSITQALRKLRQDKAREAQEKRQQEIKRQKLQEKKKRQEQELIQKGKKMKEVIDKANQLYTNISTEPPKRKQKDPQQEALQRNFGVFSFLDLQTLKKIQGQIDKYNEEEKKDRHGLERLRFLNRKDFIKILLITVAQFNLKQLKPINIIQQVIFTPNVNPIDIIIPHVHLLENLLFNELFKEGVKSRNQPYQVKIKMLRDNLYDRTNFSLRRRVLNKTINSQFILQASEQQLKSEQRKKEEKQMVERYARQANSWEDDYQKRIKKDKDEDTTENLVRYYHGQMPIDRPKVIEITEKNPQVQKYQNSLLHAFNVYNKCRKEMKQRLQKLKWGVGKRLREDWESTVQEK